MSLWVSLLLFRQSASRSLGPIWWWAFLQWLILGCNDIKYQCALFGADSLCFSSGLYLSYYCRVIWYSLPWPCSGLTHGWIFECKLLFWRRARGQCTWLWLLRLIRFFISCYTKILLLCSGRSNSSWLTFEPLGLWQSCYLCILLIRLKEGLWAFGYSVFGCI